MSADPNDKKNLHRDVRGAVLVEFLVACMPLMITFFSFLQIAQIATAKLVVKHATVVGARGAAVISNEHNNTPDQKQGKNLDQVTAGVVKALGPWSNAMEGAPEVEIEDESGCGEKVFEPVKVTVTAEYKCSVPFGGLLMCGATGGTHTIKETYSFPHQGASYWDGGGSNCPAEE